MNPGAADVHAVLVLERHRQAELRRTNEHRRIRANHVRNTPGVRDHVAGALIKIGLNLSHQQRRRWAQQSTTGSTRPVPAASPSH